jgi:hypothetical protein
LAGVYQQIAITAAARATTVDTDDNRQPFVSKTKIGASPKKWQRAIDSSDVYSSSISLPADL